MSVMLPSIAASRWILSAYFLVAISEYQPQHWWYWTQRYQHKYLTLDLIGHALYITIISIYPCALQRYHRWIILVLLFSTFLGRVHNFHSRSINLQGWVGHSLNPSPAPILFTIRNGVDSNADYLFPSCERNFKAFDTWVFIQALFSASWAM